LDRNLQTVSFSMLGHFTVRVIACLGGYSVRQRSYKLNVFIYRISFVVESFTTIHSMYIVLGHTIRIT